MSFTLELFDTPEIGKVLEEVKRVLKSRGRLGVVSMSKEDGESKLVRLYEWVHKKWPRYVDCRPIYVEQSLKDAGYEIKSKRKVSLLGLLSGEIVIAMNANSR
jgi:demethylmenaquinone methyltransferase/2-methoxy-6-polyprenyl-1,4-benzoquinol methylase